MKFNLTYHWRVEQSKTHCRDPVVQRGNPAHFVEGR